MLWPTMEQKLGSCSQVLGSYEAFAVGGYCGVRGLGGGGGGGTLGGSSSLSVGISSLLLPVTLLVGEFPVVLRWACQDGRGPQSVGRSGSGVARWRRRSQLAPVFFV